MACMMNDRDAKTERDMMRCKRCRQEKGMAVSFVVFAAKIAGFKEIRAA
jgi:hypothetical protein